MTARQFRIEEQTRADGTVNFQIQEPSAGEWTKAGLYVDLAVWPSDFDTLAAALTGFKAYRDAQSALDARRIVDRKVAHDHL